MVQEWGFSQTEVDDHTKTARSYLAHPIVFETEIVGVLYSFSTEPQVFPHAARRQHLDDAADAITGLLRAAGILR
jgi:GAF domain-containing protein